MQQENEVLAYHLQNAQNYGFDENKEEDVQPLNEDITSKQNLPPAPARPRSARGRALSAVNEDEENAATHAPSFSRTFTQPIAGDHPRFQRSTSFAVSTLDDLTKKFHVSVQSQDDGMGAIGGRRHSLLNRIRSATQHSAQFSLASMTPQTPVLYQQDSMVSSQGGFTPSQDFKGSNNPYSHIVQDSSASNYGYLHGMGDSVSDVHTPLILGDNHSNYSTMYGGRRRTRGVSILRIGTPRKRTLAAGAMDQSLDALQNMGDSTQSGITDVDDGSGYADQYREELEDDDQDEIDELDQWTELTEQLKKEVREEYEEELEKQIQSKYELKLLKKDTEFNEQLKILSQEIDRLEAENKKKTRQLKIIQQGGGIGSIRQSQNVGGIAQPLSQISAEDMKVNENDNGFMDVSALKVNNVGLEFNYDSHDQTGADTPATYDSDDITDSDDTRYKQKNGKGDDSDGMAMLDDDDDSEDEDDDHRNIDSGTAQETTDAYITTDNESRDTTDNYMMVNYDPNDKDGNYDEHTHLIQPNGSSGKKKRRKKDKDRKRKKKKKDKDNYKDYKREKEQDNKAKKEIKSSGFCCSSIFSDFGKKSKDEIDMDSAEDEPFKDKIKQREKDKSHSKKVMIIKRERGNIEVNIKIKTKIKKDKREIIKIRRDINIKQNMVIRIKIKIRINRERNINHIQRIKTRIKRN